MTGSGREKMYRYVWGILKKKNCHLYRIGGTEDHIRIVTHIHPTVAVAGLVKDIKLATSQHIKTAHIFPKFNGWQNGYGAFTYAITAIDNLIEYVKNQNEHHRKVTYREEYLPLLKEHGIEFDEKYLL